MQTRYQKNTQYTPEQKEWIRNNYNKPYDGTMFASLYYTTFEDELNTEKNANLAEENKRLYGIMQMKQRTLCAELNNLPRIQVGQLYVIEPFLLANRSMSREQTVYFRDVTKGSLNFDCKQSTILTSDLCETFAKDVLSI